jgi:hypothetical protein
MSLPTAAVGGVDSAVFRTKLNDDSDRNGLTMRLRPLVRFLALSCTLIALPALAAKPVPADKAPSAMVFGSFTTELLPETLSYVSRTDPYQRVITVPPDGAWFFGDASIYGWMDCEHHFRATLTPTNGGYDPFYTLGATGTDVCFGSNCYSCSLNFNGQKGLTYYTTDEYPGYLPGGTYTVSVETLNGGGADDWVSHYLAQVNQDAIESMRMYPAVSETDPRPAPAGTLDEMFFFAGLGDAVPVTPVFEYGNWDFPGGPNVTYSALWDRSTVETPARLGVPTVYNGHAPVLVEVPLLTTGTHKFKLVARLPNGKTFISSTATSVFVWHGDIESSYNGLKTFAPSLSLVKGDVVGFRIVQRDGGKALEVVDGGWTFDSLGLTPAYSTTGAGDPSLAGAPALWAGDMIQSGIIKAKVKVKSGKIVREAHQALARTAIVRPRASQEWTVQLELAEDIYDDLGMVDGGVLDEAYYFPTRANLEAYRAIKNTQTYRWATGINGDRLTYERGKFDRSTGAQQIGPRKLPILLPLYRPADPFNDPDDYANRFTVKQVQTGPWRGWYFMTEQHIRIRRLALTISYLHPAPAIGQDPSRYRSFVLKAGCTNAADANCYQPVSNCWSTLSSGRGYLEYVATLTNQYNNNQPFEMTRLWTQSAEHERRVHYQMAILDLFAAEPKFNIAEVFERSLIPATEASSVESATQLYDQLMQNTERDWARHPSGGRYEETDPTIPYVALDDTPGQCSWLVGF